MQVGRIAAEFSLDRKTGHAIADGIAIRILRRQRDRQRCTCAHFVIEILRDRRGISLDHLDLHHGDGRVDGTVVRDETETVFASKIMLRHIHPIVAGTRELAMQRLADDAEGERISLGIDRRQPDRQGDILVGLQLLRNRDRCIVDGPDDDARGRRRRILRSIVRDVNEAVVPAPLGLRNIGQGRAAALQRSMHRRLHDAIRKHSTFRIRCLQRQLQRHVLIRGQGQIHSLRRVVHREDLDGYGRDGRTEFPVAGAITEFIGPRITRRRNVDPRIRVAAQLPMLRRRHDDVLQSIRFGIASR